MDKIKDIPLLIQALLMDKVVKGILQLLMVKDKVILHLKDKDKVKDKVKDILLHPMDKDKVTQHHMDKDKVKDILLPLMDKDKLVQLLKDKDYHNIENTQLHWKTKEQK